MDETIQNNEKAILTAAEKLFLEKGYSAVSTTAISKEAGCSQAMVHYYYRSKENLFSLVFKNKVAPFLASLLDIKFEDLPFEERLKKRIRAHFDMLQANERLPIILLNEVFGNEKLTKSMLEIVKELPFPLLIQLQKELDEEYHAGRIRKSSSTDLVFQIISLNLMAVLMKPFLKLLTNADDQKIHQITEDRKEANVVAIVGSLKI